MFRKTKLGLFATVLILSGINNFDFITANAEESNDIIIEATNQEQIKEYEIALNEFMSDIENKSNEEIEEFILEYSLYLDSDMNLNTKDKSFKDYLHAYDFSIISEYLIQNQDHSEKDHAQSELDKASEEPADDELKAENEIKETDNIEKPSVIIEETEETIQESEPVSEHHLIAEQKENAVKTSSTKDGNSSNSKAIESIETANKVAYSGIITNAEGNIFTKPKELNASTKTDKVVNHLNKRVVVREEIKVANRNWIMVESNGNKIGWMLKSKITPIYDQIHSKETVAYEAELVGGRFQIFNKPAYTSGNKQVANSENYIDKYAVIRSEIVTKKATWVLLEIEGKEIGWLNKKGIKPLYDSINSETNVAYEAKLIGGRFQIFNKPAYTKGNVQVADSTDYYNDYAVIRKEIVTDRATWVLLEAGGEEIGWLNKKGISASYDTINSDKNVAYEAKLIGGRFQIFSKPAYTKGNVQVADSTDYYNDYAVIRKEVVTDRATWVLLEAGGEEIGWLNKKGIKPIYDVIRSENEVAYEAKLIGGRFQIFNKPAYTKGSTQVADSTDYYSDYAVIRKEIVTKRATWVLLEAGGKEIGWLNKKGIKPTYDKIRYTRSTNYIRKIGNTNFQIFNIPAYTKGNKVVANTSNFIGKFVSIKEEKQTKRATWSLISINGKTIGWINRKALKVASIYLDAGHGGYEAGAVSGGVKEKDINLQIVRKLLPKLEKSGFDVILSRDDDSRVSLSARAQEANKSNADVFISVHHNAFRGTSQGIETYYYNKNGDTNNPLANDNYRITASRKLANQIHSKLLSYTGAKDRYVRAANYHVLRETKIPAVLLELGYMDNAAERAKLITPSYQDKLVKAIHEGILNFF